MCRAAGRVAGKGGANGELSVSVQRGIVVVSVGAGQHGGAVEAVERVAPVAHGIDGDHLPVGLLVADGAAYGSGGLHGSCGTSGKRKWQYGVSEFHL